MSAYYNEHDRFKAEWLRKLMAAEAIADGEVDERDIREVEHADLRGFSQCHFFAGIGVWSYALRAAGWADNTPVWTGSCPCQSFSQCGKRAGFSDQRHLWPAWFRLVRESRPEHVFGEQVASKDGLAWFDVVSADLEGAGYAVGAADTCAAGYGAPMLSQRLYFVAEALGPAGSLVLQWDESESDAERRELEKQHTELSSGAVRGFWAGAEWIPCREGCLRPIEPGTFPLAHGAANRVGKLRGYGDALCAEQAVGFIEAYLQIARDRTAMRTA